MVKALEDKKSLLAPGICAAVSIQIPIASFLVLTLAPIGRRRDGRIPARAASARLAAWMASFLVALSVAVFSGTVAVTFKAFEERLLFGLVPWTRWGALAGLLAGVVGVAGVILAIRAYKRNKLPVATLSGFLLTGCAAIRFAAFLVWWDLGPF